MNTINEIIKSIERLKPISPGAIEIIDIVTRDDVEISEVTRLINQDPAMAR